MPEAPICGEQ
jgi:hypothetical protein